MKNIGLLFILIVSPIYGDVNLQITFRDGSIMKVTTKTEFLTVNTIYGTLKVPLSDTDDIQFGSPLNPEQKTFLEENLARLTKESYSERVQAQKNLTARGDLYYIFLLENKDHPNLEIRNRVRAMLKDTNREFAPSRIRFMKKDVIKTRHFTIVGYIQEIEIWVKHEFLSKNSLIQVDFSDVKTIENLIPSPTYLNVSAKTGWTRTGLFIKKDQYVKIQSSGTVDLYPWEPGIYTTGPTGYFAPTRTHGLECPAGTLMAKIEDRGKVFRIGELYRGYPGEGYLWLIIADSPWNNLSSGDYRISISHKR